MASTIKFKFDPNQEHQAIAVESTLRLFEKLPQGHSEFKLGDEIVSNLPLDETIDEDVLLTNLQSVQQLNKVSQNSRLDVDDGLPIERSGNRSWRYPVFTVEMETGTGKTYVYLRTIYELKKRFGFRKFIIVVPSIAIYEGVLKSIKITREHFKSLFNNEYLNVIAYDSDQISKLRDFATSQFLQVMIITMAAFNKSSNNIYKRTEKLPGERLPIEYIQEARPILILDESQNYASGKSKEALRALHPLLAIKYSATPGEHVSEGIIRYDNLIHRLTPVEAFRMNLVKRIQVFGVTEKENFNNEFLISLKKVNNDLSANMALIANNRGQFIEKEYTLKKGDDLSTKTKNEHYKGYIIEEINRRHNQVHFTNGSITSLTGEQDFTLSKQEIFRIQIEETVRQHLQRQKELFKKGIKVLSLFFIDKVANYTEEKALIKQLFDEAFESFKIGYPLFEKKSAEEVRSAYFAKKKTKQGEIAIDTLAKNQAERNAEKEAFKLIMEDKERLLSFDENVSFIFAHSALKEGWDNPNVFQICTLRDTTSEMRKRQEIGRGMRLCVDQTGERIFDPDINVLTVVANESYEDFVMSLQSEYAEDGEVAPERPSNARSAPAKRNSSIYRSNEFTSFWDKLIRKSIYKISIDTDKVTKDVAQKFSKEHIAPPVMLVKKGKFVITHFEIHLVSISGKKAIIDIKISDTLGQENNHKKEFHVKDDLSKILHDPRLRHFKIVDIISASEGARVEFSEGGTLTKDSPIIFDTEEGQRIDERTVIGTKANYPVSNLIGRAAKETMLTRATVIKIFSALPDDKKRMIFLNPEGFAKRFIFIIKEILSDHVAENIKYSLAKGQSESCDKEILFPKEKRFPQKELIDGSDKSLYDLVQIDSDVERRFVQNRLNLDQKILLYFKFPPMFKINVPKIIGNYNPDWGIVRFTDAGSYKLELVRETKGTVHDNLLQYANEKRKIWCAQKHFKELGISYRRISPDTVNWWTDESSELDLFEQIVQEIEKNLEYTEYLPVYSFEAAAGKFSEGQKAQPEGWIKADIGRKLDDRMFAIKVVGRSMEPTIPSGSYCAFQADVVGSRQGKILLVEHHDITDPDTHSRYTVKRYRSEKEYAKDDTWGHKEIVLEPINKDYEPIILSADTADEFKVIGEFVAVI